MQKKMNMIVSHTSDNELFNFKNMHFLRTDRLMLIDSRLKLSKPNFLTHTWFDSDLLNSETMQWNSPSSDRREADAILLPAGLTAVSRFSRKGKQ